jgi:hypothetical protein
MRGPLAGGPYLTSDDPPEVAFYCPDCAMREFGDG